MAADIFIGVRSLVQVMGRLPCVLVWDGSSRIPSAEYDGASEVSNEFTPFLACIYAELRPIQRGVSVDTPLTSTQSEFDELRTLSHASSSRPLVSKSRYARSLRSTVDLPAA